MIPNIPRLSISQLTVSVPNHTYASVLNSSFNRIYGNDTQVIILVFVNLVELRYIIQKQTLNLSIILVYFRHYSRSNQLGSFLF